MNAQSAQSMNVPAVLALADGSLFFGNSIGVSGVTVGEVVFNTSTTGYQEILTDPSYAEQLVSLTYPHIGNVGINESDAESSKVWVAGLIIREYSAPSNWRSEQSLSEYLKRQHIISISGIDTRRLTRLIRDKGAQSGCIMAGDDLDPEVALREARAYTGLVGKDLTNSVSIKDIKRWEQGTLSLTETAMAESVKQYHAVVYDLGVKYQILRLLVDYGCRITLVPAQTSVEEVLALQPDGIVFSNGPGDPAACHDIIIRIQHYLDKNIPLLGICLGFQLFALALGGRTVKMKFGHHGSNHPVQDLTTGQVFITSQNHGFSVDEATLPVELILTHRSLFDGSLQGFAHATKPMIAFQGHPESSPGPHDIRGIFFQFIQLMQKHAQT